MINVVTAFNRKENKELMIAHLNEQEIKWTVLITKDIVFPDWVEKITVTDPLKSCYSRFNQYLEMNLLHDETQYMFLNDDDFVEPGFWKKIPNDHDIVFVSRNVEIMRNFMEIAHLLLKKKICLLVVSGYNTSSKENY